MSKTSNAARRKRQRERRAATRLTEEELRKIERPLKETDICGVKDATPFVAVRHIIHDQIERAKMIKHEMYNQKIKGE